MDTLTLVGEQISDGERLLDSLRQEGIAVRAAGWVKPADEDRWSLYIATPLVDEKGPIDAYREVYRVLRSLEDLQVKDYEVKLVGEGQQATKDLLKARPRGDAGQRTPLTSVGGVPVEEVYVYPAPQARATGPRPSVLRFVIRSAGHPMEIMSRFHPQGKVLLNRTEWRGKESRSCGVISVKGRPHAFGDRDPAVYDVEVAYRPKGCVTYMGGTKYDGWAALVLDRAEDGVLLNGEGAPLPEGHAPVYRRVEVFDDIDFNDIDFGEFVGEFEAEGVKHVSFDYVMGWLQRARRVSGGLTSSFVAPRRYRPPVKIVLSNNPSGTATDGFGTTIVNVNKETPQLRQVILDHVTELVNGFVEGRYSIKNTTIDEFVFAELDDALVDCTPNEEGRQSRFNCLCKYLPDTYLDELAMRLMATYEVDVSVVDGPRIGLLLRRIDRSHRD